MTGRPARIVFLDRATLPDDIALAAPDAPHTLNLHARTNVDDLAARLAGAEVAITNKVRIDAAALDAAPSLRLVAVAATGTDIVDLGACAERGIAVSNVRDYASVSVAEHVFALTLALRRSLLAYRDAVAAGRWQASGQFCFLDHPIADLAGSTLGIVGDGALGQATAALGRALGMRVLMATHRGRAGMGRLYTSFETVLAESDVISLHCPLTDATRGLVDAEAFTLMRRRPLLINTARGGLIDTGALANALRSGQIAGAGLDVAAQEPPPADDPLMALLGLPNVILTPHIAWASRQAIQTLADQLMETIALFLRGTPRNLVVTPGLPR